MENIKNFPAENRAEEGSSAFSDNGAITLRELRASELMLMIRIIGKIGIREFSCLLEDDGIKNAISAAMSQEETDTPQDYTAVGATVMLGLADTICRNLPKAEKEIYTLVSNLSGLTLTEVGALRADVFLDIILQIVTREDFKGFFTVARKYLK